MKALREVLKTEDLKRGWPKYRPKIKYLYYYDKHLFVVIYLSKFT